MKGLLNQQSGNVYFTLQERAFVRRPAGHTQHEHRIIIYKSPRIRINKHPKARQPIRKTRRFSVTLRLSTNIKQKNRI